MPRKVVSTRASRPIGIKSEMNMSKKLKLAFLAAVLTVIGAISAPVLAAGSDEYDNPAINGGGSSGYNAHLGAGNS